MQIRILNSVIRAPLLLLACVEFLLLCASVYAGSYIVYGDLALAATVGGSILPKAIIMSLVILISLISMGLYQFNQRMSFRETLLRVIAGVGAGELVMWAIFYVVPMITLSRLVVLWSTVCALVGLGIVRWYFRRNVDENIFRRKVLVYGAGVRAASIGDMRRRADRRGFRIVGQIRASGDKPSESGAALSTNGKTICQIAAELDADEIVVAMDDRRGNLPIRELLDCRLKGFEVIDLLEFLERETGKIRVDLVNPGWLIFSSGFRVSPFRLFNKRMLDLVVSIALFLVSWPIMLLVAIAIKLEDGLSAPILYRQCRLGEGAVPFNVLKFRSMREDAETDGKAVWATEEDARITKVGNVLRKYRLDELPQIINVLRGEMSLVGPRPERPEFVTQLQEKIPYYSERHAVKPGLTGWAQLRYSYGSTEEETVEKLQYDLYYIKDQSFLLDLVIILQTVEVVLWGKGAR